MISWDTCRQDFEWDGSWRDIYVTPATLDDWKAIFPLLRSQPDVEFMCESGAVSVPASLDESFFGDARPTLRFRVGGVLVVFHFFTPEEIECDIDPREITGQASLDAVLALMRQFGDLTHKRTVLTPENDSDHPIISYDPESREFEYHEVAA
jgi:hypothetical protein